jgi:hypothetical protein
METKEPTTLQDYLNRHNRRIDNVVAFRPAWLRRKDEQGLPLQVDFRIKRPGPDAA